MMPDFIDALGKWTTRKRALRDTTGMSAEISAAKDGPPMSALGQKRTLPLKADMRELFRYVRFVPKADKRTAAKKGAIRSPRWRGRAALANLIVGQIIQNFIAVPPDQVLSRVPGKYPLG